MPQVEDHSHNGRDSGRVGYIDLKGGPEIDIEYGLPHHVFRVTAANRVTMTNTQYGVDLTLCSPTVADTVVLTSYPDTAGGPGIETKKFYDLKPEYGIVANFDLDAGATATDDVDLYLGVGYGWAVTGTIEKHIGFRMHRAAGDSTFDLYTRTHDGTTLEEKLVQSGLSNGVVYILGFRHDGDGVSFWVNNINVSRHTTNIPTGHIITATSDDTLHFFAFNTGGTDYANLEIRALSLKHKAFNNPH